MIAKAARQLPPQMPSPPSYQKVNPGRPAGALPGAPLADAAAVGDQRVRRDRPSRSASRWSTASPRSTSSARQKYAVRVDVDPRKLAAHSIGIDEVATAITNANVNLPTGTTVRRQDVRRTRPTASCSAPTPTAPTIISYRDGNPIRLERGRPRLRRRRERQERRLVQRRADHLPGDPEAAGHQRRRRRATRSRRCCRPSASSCRRR